MDSCRNSLLHLMALRIANYYLYTVCPRKTETCRDKIAKSRPILTKFAGNDAAYFGNIHAKCYEKILKIDGVINC